MVFDKVKSFFDREEYSPAALFEVKNLIGDNSNLVIPEKKVVESRLEENEEDLIIGFVVKSGGRIGASDLLNHCVENDVCSRATFFRKIKVLVDNKQLKKVKEGRKSFYQILE